MCMTIPHQECKEVLTPVCQQVSRRQCDLVPQETCQVEAETFFVFKEHRDFIGAIQQIELIK